MSSSEANQPFREEPRNGNQLTVDPMALQGELDVVDDGYAMKEAKGVEETSSPDSADAYDFDRYDPQREIERQDQIRADRIARRRIPANVFQKYFGKAVPYGGLLSTGLNLASSSIGAGIIAMPLAFNSSGLVMGLIYMVVVAYLTVYSYYLLGFAAQKTGLRSYEMIVRTLLGPGADYFLALCMWLFSFGAELSYVISLKDVLTAFLEDSPNTPDFLRGIWGQRVLTVAVWLFFMLPLTLLKEINTLRYFSCVAVLFIIFFVVCMVVHSAQNGLRQHPRPEIKMVNTGNTAIGGLTTFVFAFLSQLNAMEVAEELYKPSPLRLTLGASVGVAIVFVLYLFAGLFGYLDFGPKVTTSALKMYNPVQDPLMGVGYGGIMLKLCVGYGLHMIPVRQAVYYCFRADVHRLPWWKNACVCTFLALLSLVAGLFIPSINVVFGLVGGFCGGFIGFIYPAFMMMYAGNWTFSSVGWFHYFSTYLLLIVGVIGVVWGTASSIYGEI
ncbi:putative amino acid permease [Leptomonas pyrrhocoris]|uniref:Putative amino acid permease n=1 Tax=Leptomonas pyrrhocoris TaxID=157538 RepID=A0A0N0DR10_LEPPY|nr:putative amino acid permease [Leptomonas pyrrhocoris]XP_015652398.1 putative amino acid permease [Leptomonas pyrrhocoris]XP_015652399.1 putative amino acid permease [Leptomonas pyrrhocoris]XP_015652400.1 putative amino acid permease [Leptomonas pyrrhocoris]XP_015652401.1 putative amino acid permease [Leptomonas pyrrhocoris]XP_015652402.1 putative amino acid permease [Leptomonas pyrrhocoris]KPA73958.1 putative amino acid permease [Leptomonas pyrrhocoris]KPA73959.1 putative amino acid perme|eukprot:XP_015652397.1 putative amino acid permease [Leptomonas pyrrhocoris]